MQKILRVSVSLLVFCSVACQAPIAYRKVKPQPALVSRDAPGAVQRARQLVESGDEMKQRDPLAAAGQYVEAARIVAPLATARHTDALPLYNYSVARVVETLGAAHALPWGKSIGLSSGTLRGELERPGASANRNYIVLDQISFYGEDLWRETKCAGIGAPLVSIEHENRHYRKNYGEEHQHTALTAVLLFHGSRGATLKLYDPYQTKTVSVAGRSSALAADFTAPASIYTAEERPDRLGLIRLLRPGKFANTARLTRLQPYDKNRIPVLFIHGLQDTPVTWGPMYSELMRDPLLRDRYQFWVFSYPSGYPYPYSAMLLRRELDGVEKAFPDHKDIILIGHSMGGVISRLMVTDAEDKIWREYFGKPPEKTKITGSNRKLLMEALVFHQRPEVHRVIFISAPHRGSELASNWIGRIGSKLVRLPGSLADMRDTFTSLLTVDQAAMTLNRMPNSIDTLSPTNRFVRTVNRLPIAPGVTYHSIMGDRGRGDTPNSSDGVVPYWSSHLEGAASEKIVPSHHSAHQNPEGIAEVHRILRAYAGNQ